MFRRLTIVPFLLGSVGLASMACVDVERLTAEVQGVEETADGIAVTVSISNEGEPQNLATVESGVLAIDTEGGTWNAADVCSTIVGQNVYAGQPVTGTVCFPFDRLSDETGNFDPYVPRGTTLAYLMLTDNFFVDDQDLFHLRPIAPDTASETATPSAPASPAPTLPETVTVDVTVWEHVTTGTLYLSTRPQGQDWTTHTTPLDMSQLHEGRQFYQGSAITVEIPVEPIE